MARITIRGRKEPIEIDNGRVLGLKNKWLGLMGEEKADARSIVNLGVWAGEYGRIVEIEMTPESQPESNVVDRAEQERLREQELLKEPPELRGTYIGRFTFLWCSLHGNFKIKPDEEIIAEAIAIQTVYYAEHPDALYVPREVYGTLLPGGKPYSLVDQMST